MRSVFILVLFFVSFIGSLDSYAQKGKEGDKKLFVPKSAQVRDSKLVPQKVTDYITVPVPEDFRLMNDDELAARYPSGRKPLAMYANSDLMTNFGVNATNNAWNEKDLVILKDFQKANIRTLYEGVTFTRDEITKIGKKQFAIFEFMTDPAAGKATTAKYKQYFILMYCIIKGQVFVINFNCPENEKTLWLPMAKKMVDGVKVTK